MKPGHVIMLVLVLGVLFLLLSVVSWTNAYVVQDDISSEQRDLLGGLSLVSPFLVGILIVAVVFLLILIAVRD
jgi:drug/metabolite transporter (DMT)-like permease